MHIRHRFPSWLPWALSLPVFLVGALPPSAEGQEFEALVASCAANTGGLIGQCHMSALALDAARGGLGTATAMGSDVAGSASTLGFRLRTFPRTAISARAGLTAFSMPDIRLGPALSGGDEDVWVPSFHLTGTVGVFNGFTLLPTVGGVLALDLTAGTHLLFPGEGDGFRTDSPNWSVGARLGILRESFSLPGVSLSVTQHWMAETTVGNLSQGDEAQVEFEPDLTSFRGIVGKDILGVGFVAGAGLDRMAGKGTLRLRVLGEKFEAEATATDLPSDRAVFFAGGSMTYLILQFSGEIGWAQPLDAPLPIEPGGNAFPSEKAYFGSLALRVTF